jgi:hypothetical protein
MKNGEQRSAKDLEESCRDIIVCLKQLGKPSSVELESLPGHVLNTFQIWVQSVKIQQPA